MKKITERYYATKDVHADMINLFSGMAVYEKSFEKGDSPWDHMISYDFDFDDSSAHLTFRKHKVLGPNGCKHYDTILTYKEKDSEKIAEIKKTLMSRLTLPRID